MGSASREAGAAASALGAYLTTVLPRARSEVRRWGPLAPEKAMNAEAVAVFASLAPRPTRATAVRAIVALQVAIDLRDELEEAGEDDARAGERIARLEDAWRREAAKLPSHPAVAELLERAVERCAEGQRQTHAAAHRGPDELRTWAAGLGAPAEFRWWEVAAAASSSVAAHALIAAAADRGMTAEAATLIDAAYHPPIGALTVLLDDLVDFDEDRAAGEHNYMAYYGGAEESADRLGLIAERAVARTGQLPHAGRHAAILAGVAAFYLSDRAIDDEPAETIRHRLLAPLGPGARFLAAFMRIRRLF